MKWDFFAMMGIFTGIIALGLLGFIVWAMYQIVMWVISK